MPVRIINNTDWGGEYSQQFIYYYPEIVQDWVFTEVEPNSELIKATWNGTQWIEGATPEEIAEYNALKVPKEVPNMNFRLALIHFGILPSSIDFAISQITDENTKETFISLWDYANTMERNSPKLIQMAQAFGINEDQLYEIFKYADTL